MGHKKEQVVRGTRSRSEPRALHTFPFSCRVLARVTQLHRKALCTVGSIFWHQLARKHYGRDGHFPQSMETSHITSPAPDSNAAAVLLELMGTEQPAAAPPHLTRAVPDDEKSLIPNVAPPMDIVNTLVLRGLGACLSDTSARVSAVCLNPTATFTVTVDFQHAITDVRVSHPKDAII
jgi:hypothetical protein